MQLSLNILGCLLWLLDLDERMLLMHILGLAILAQVIVLAYRTLIANTNDGVHIAPITYIILMGRRSSLGLGGCSFLHALTHRLISLRCEFINHLADIAHHPAELSGSTMTVAMTASVALLAVVVISVLSVLLATFSLSMLLFFLFVAI